MKKILLYVLLMFIPCLASAQEKTLTFLGDSRALGLYLSEVCDPTYAEFAAYGCGFKPVSNAVDPRDESNPDDDVAILAEDAIGKIVSGGIGGATTDTWIENIIDHLYIPYTSDVTHISIGGNDVFKIFTTETCQYKSAFLVTGNWKFFFSWLWQTEVLTDLTAQKAKLIIKYILDKDPDNKVLLNDVAPIMMIKTVGDSLVINQIFDILNAKLDRIVVNDLSINYGDRVQFLRTYKFFNDKIMSGDLSHLADGVHYTVKGNTEWGRMIAKRLGALGWLDLNTSLCTGDNNPPTYVLPENGSVTKLSPIGVGIQIPLDVTMYDDGQILDVSSGEKISDMEGGCMYRFVINSLSFQNLGASNTYSDIVTITDTCGNKSRFNLQYTISNSWYVQVYWWYWYQFTITYNFTPL